MNEMTPASVGPVLVVDDDALMRSMAVRTLIHAGLQAQGVASGEEALECLPALAPSLLLLDVVMPGLSGYEVCERVRALPQGGNLPIIMLTGLNEIESIDQAYRAGATDFIAKPIHWTLLAQRVRYALRAAAAAESAARNSERLERAQRMAAMGNWMIVDAGQRMNCSPALAELFGARKEDAASCATPPAFLERVHEQDRDRVRAAREAAWRRGKAYRLAYRMQRLDGAERSVFEQGVPMLDAAGRPVGVEGFTQDITERVEAELRIAHLARHDAVTGLPNRIFFEELGAPALERARRNAEVCALLHLDLDRFKSINDAIGQAEGDTVLRRIGQRLRESCRQCDLAAIAHDDEPALARVGSNAFTVLLVGVGNDRQAAQVATRLMDAISQPLEVDGHEVVMTASVGIAMFPRDAADHRTLARCAEQAAYDAKADGGGRSRFFDAAMNDAASMRLMRETELRHAIAAGELRLHYQPKVDATDGRIVGAEALVRWQHPQRGLLLPGEFILIAEEAGLILPLTDWVLNAACLDQRRRRDAGLLAVPVSVNLSGASLAQDGLAAQLRELLQRHGGAAEHLVLEVTETQLMKDPQAAARRLGELRDAGLRMSLDDFGTGYSSLSYLQQFPVDELKIDRSFVADVPSGNGHGAIARAVIALAREFGLHVVAEGVETREQAEFLVRQGCRVHQGYLYARPMDRAAFDELLARGRISL
jgi:diguanylate cyclase (GGDEF)-like protein/PAS domain S-box-containing protein